MELWFHVIVDLKVHKTSYLHIFNCWRLHKFILINKCEEKLKFSVFGGTAIKSTETSS